MADLGGTVKCPPSAPCCQLDHSHDQAANSCPGIAAGGHPGTACVLDTACGVFTPKGEACPGGHCQQGNPDCTVCRTVTIEVIPGSTNLSLLGGNFAQQGG
jgi:hypothetical protein